MLVGLNLLKNKPKQKLETDLVVIVYALAVDPKIIPNICHLSLPLFFLVLLIFGQQFDYS